LGFQIANFGIGIPGGGLGFQMAIFGIGIPGGGFGFQIASFGIGIPGGGLGFHISAFLATVVWVFANTPNEKINSRARLNARILMMAARIPISF